MTNPAIDEYGNKYWTVNGEYHRLDGPAIERANGTNYWYVKGERHRLDGPAVEWNDGTKEWWINDRLHRLDRPAVEWSDGNKFWYVDDEKLSGPLDLLKHGVKLEDIAEYLTPREIAKLKLDK